MSLGTRVRLCLKDLYSQDVVEMIERETRKYEVEAIEHPDHPDFKRAFEILWEAFGEAGEMEPLARALEEECRRLHAAYVGRREALIEVSETRAVALGRALAVDRARPARVLAGVPRGPRRSAAAFRSGSTSGLRARSTSARPPCRGLPDRP